LQVDRLGCGTGFDGVNYSTFIQFEDADAASGTAGGHVGQTIISEGKTVHRLRL